MPRWPVVRRRSPPPRAPPSGSMAPTNSLARRRARTASLCVTALTSSSARCRSRRRSARTVLSARGYRWRRFTNRPTNRDSTTSCPHWLPVGRMSAPRSAATAAWKQASSHRLAQCSNRPWSYSCSAPRRLSIAFRTYGSSPVGTPSGRWSLPRALRRVVAPTARAVRRAPPRGRARRRRPRPLVVPGPSSPLDRPPPRAAAPRRWWWYGSARN